MRVSVRNRFGDAGWVNDAREDGGSRAQRPQKRLTNGVSGVKCDGRWRTNLQPGELGVLLGAPHAGALSVGHLNCLVSRLLGRVRDYTPRSMRRRRANVNAAGVQRSSSGDEKTPTMEARLIAVLRCAREPKRRADGLVG